MSSSLRGRAMVVARVAFCVAVVWFVWWGLRGRGGEVRAALADTPVAGLLVALVLVVIGLIPTGFVWLRIMRAYGYPLAQRDGLSIFFVGQLGKYIPGSVWTFGAQADRARRHDVPVRVTVGASLVFLGVNVSTSMLLGLLLVLISPLAVEAPTWLVVAGVLGAGLSLLPPVVNWLATRVAGRETPLRLGYADQLVVLLLTGLTWAAYAASLVALLPDAHAREVAVLVGAFLLAYAAGVLVFLAPAGLGAREAVFVLCAAPAVGVAVATSIALLTRVLFTVADVLVAVVTRLAARSSGLRRHEKCR